MQLAGEESSPRTGAPSFFRRSEKERLEPSPGLTPGKQVGDFRLVSLIGQGGMGQVWEAEQLSLHRQVAVKFVRPERVTAHQLELFAREARAGGRLSHSGIVSVYGHGEADGLAWIAMEFVGGTWTLKDFLDEAARASELPEGYDRHVARFVAEIAEALQTAHEAGVIHRDVKPQNVLITADDHPKVTDFGLARLTDEAALSVTGDFAGTYLYMSPEQAMAKRMGLDHRTDVFSLGVVLYELLALRRPFEGDTPQQVAEQIVTKDPPDPRAIRSKIPRDLAVIANHALEKERDKRYPTMKEFAADLRRYFADEPIHATPPTRLDRAVKWVKRNPAKSSVAAVVAVTFTAIAVLLAANVRTNLALAIKTAQAEASAREALDNAETARTNEERALTGEALAKENAERASQEARTARRTADFLTGLFAVVDPGEARGNTVTAREILDRGASRIEAELQEEPEVRASLMGTMGVVYSRLGLYQAALPLLRGSLDERRRAFGDQDERVAESQNNLGATLGLAADYEDAERELRAALDVRRRLLGEHPAVAESLHELGVVLAARGKFSEAEALLREALGLRRKLLGRHPDVAASLNELAFAIYDQRVTEGVEELLREALDLRTELLGLHPATAESLNNLGTFLYEQERQKEAIPLWRQSLEMKRQLFGGVHPDVAKSLNNLAFALHDAGDLDGAEELYRSAVEQQRALLGDAHPDLGQALNNLAFVLHDRGDYEGARACFFEAVAVYRRALGDGNTTVLDAIANAKGLVTRTIQNRERELGAEHPDTVGARLDLAELYRIAGRPGDARPLAEEAWLLLSKGANSDGALAARAQSVLGAVLADQGELREAEQLLQAGFTGLLKLLGPDDPGARVAGDRLAVLFEKTNRPGEAARVRVLLTSPEPGTGRR